MEVDNDSQRVVEFESTTQEPKRSGRICQEPKRYGFLVDDKMEVDSDSQRVVESESTTQEPRRSGRIRHEPERYEFLVIDDKYLILVDQNEPTTYQEAIENQESKKHGF